MNDACVYSILSLSIPESYSPVLVGLFLILHYRRDKAERQSPVQNWLEVCIFLFWSHNSIISASIPPPVMKKKPILHLDFIIFNISMTYLYTEFFSHLSKPVLRIRIRSDPDLFYWIRIQLSSGDPAPDKNLMNGHLLIKSVFNHPKEKSFTLFLRNKHR